MQSGDTSHEEDEEEGCGGSRDSARTGLLHLGADDRPHRAEGCMTPDEGAEDKSGKSLVQVMGTVVQRGEVGESSRIVQLRVEKLISDGIRQKAPAV